MLGVTIYEMGRDKKAKACGTIKLQDDKLVCDPADDLMLQEILTTSARGDKYSPAHISATDDPVKFLDNLHFHYRSPYLFASKVENIP